MALANLDFFRAAVFLWISFLDAALSMALTVSLNTDSVLAPDEMAILHFLTEVFKADLRMTFFNALLLFILTRLMADLMFGNLLTPFGGQFIEQCAAVDILAHCGVLMQALIDTRRHI